jgi:hypothetical protein
MRFHCSLTIPESLSRDAAARIRETFAALGWEEADGMLVFSVPADPFAVDGPSVTLGRMLQGLCSGSEAFGESAPATLACRYRDHEVFSAPVTLGVFSGTGGAGLAVDQTAPPLFRDLIRLRDKMLATLQRAARKSRSQ